MVVQEIDSKLIFQHKHRPNMLMIFLNVLFLTALFITFSMMVWGIPDYYPTPVRMVFFALWLVLWIALAFIVFLSLMWESFGKEVILFTDERLRIERHVGRLKYPRTFLLSRVSDLRTGSVDSNLMKRFLSILKPRASLLTATDLFFGRGSGTFSFMYNHKKYRFGYKMSAHDADVLLRRVAAKYQKNIETI